MLFGKYLLKFFVHFLIRLFVILLLNCRSPLYVLDINPYDTRFSNIFSHSVTCLFTPFNASSDAQKILILMKSNLYIFFILLPVLWGSYSRNHCQFWIHKVSPVVLLKNVIVFALTFRSLIRIEFILAYGVPLGCNFTLLQVDIQFPSIMCWKASLSPLNDLDTLVDNHLTTCVRVSYEALYSIPFVYISALKPVPTTRLWYWGFVGSFQVRKSASSNYVLLFQDCFVIWGFLRFHMNFKIGFSISTKKKKKNTTEILMGIALNL